MRLFSAISCIHTLQLQAPSSPPTARSPHRTSTVSTHAALIGRDRHVVSTPFSLAQARSQRPHLIGMHPHTPAASLTSLTSRSRQTTVAAAERRMEPLPPSATAYTAEAAGHGASKTAKKRGVQKLLMSAFKRVEHDGAPGSSSTCKGRGGGHLSDAAAAPQDFTWSSSSSPGGRKGRKAGGGGGDDSSADGDRSSHDSLDMEGNVYRTHHSITFNNAQMCARPWP